MLGFSKGQVFRPKVLDLHDTLAQISDMLRRLIGEDIQLEMDCDSELGHIRFDPAQFEQIMVNLGLNARDVMPGGGKLRIEAANVDLSGITRNGMDNVSAGTYVRLRVSKAT